MGTSLLQLGILALLIASTNATPAFPPVADERLGRYTALRVDQPLELDGRPNEAAWVAAERTPAFVDLITGAATRFDTRAAFLWDDTYLYVAYWVEEPDVHATHTNQDDPVYRGNNVELFIAGTNAYYEFEMNALETVYDAFFIWQDAYESAGFSKLADFDRSRDDVRSSVFNGVGYRNHPRGKRYAFIPWDLPNVRTAVHVDGTLNDHSDRDRGWTVELALPWKELRRLTTGEKRALPPRDGDVWRIDASRFNRLRYHPEDSLGNPTGKDSGGWSWNPHGAWDSHIPECFGYVTFSTEVCGAPSLDKTANGNRTDQQD